MFGFLVLNMHFYKWSYYNIKNICIKILRISDYNKLVRGLS